MSHVRGWALVLARSLLTLIDGRSDLTPAASQREVHMLQRFMPITRSITTGMALALASAAGCSKSSPENAPASAGGAPARSTSSERDAPTAPADGTSDVGLAMTPPMGFNDWNAFGCNVSETLIKETADFFVSSGLKDVGYTYVNIDDCWSLRERGADGRLVPDPVKFPSGIKGVADYVHGLGLKLGIYGDAGTNTCAGYPGSLGTEELDAQTWADWGVDYLKYDNCFNESDGSRQDFVDRYTAMRRAIDETGRAMVYSICEWGQSQPWEWATGVGHLWRTTGDITDNWSSVRSIIAQNVPLAQYAGPGHWNDPDMLEIGNGGMTATEYRTHMSMWSMMAAPLIIGTDLRVATAETLAILGNRELIAINQDALGKQATLVSDDGSGHLVLQKPLSNGDTAIALYNASDALSVMNVAAAQTGLGSATAYRVRDAWTGIERESAGVIAAGVPAHGAVVFRSSPLAELAGLPPLISVGGVVGALIGGLAEGATLTTSVSNHGANPATSIAVAISGVPEGWTLTASNASTADSLASGASLDTNWTVTVPASATAGVYALTVTASYRFGPDAREASMVSELSTTVVVPPLDGTTHLSLLVPVSAANGSGQVEIDTSNGGQAPLDGNLITIGGQVYTRGLGTNAPSRSVYYLGGRCSSLSVDVGIDDEVTTGGSATFSIRADDTLVVASGVLTSADAPQTLTADVTGATLVELVTDPGADSDGDHTDWALPRIVCGNGTAPTSSEQTLFSFEGGTDDFTIANVAAGGTAVASTAFHTDGTGGLEVTSPTDGNWFGKALAAPLDLTGKSALAFDLKTNAEGTAGELAVEVGTGAASAWCQGGRWIWTNPNASRTVKTAFADMSCPPGVTLDVAQIRAVWTFLKGGTFIIDQVRAE
jgi:alpha-galactosidase